MNPNKTDDRLTLEAPPATLPLSVPVNGENPSLPSTKRKRRAMSTSFNDIDLKHWKHYEEILTDSLWIMPGREKAHGHKLDYHGNFIPQIVYQLFSRFTKKGEVALDLFLGSGTSALEAVHLNRKLIGVELKPDLLEYVKKKIPHDLLDQQVFLIQGDSTNDAIKSKIQNTLATLGEKFVKLVILHPPYHDIIKFSPLKEDLSNAKSTEEFLSLFLSTARITYDLLEPGRFAALVIGDKYAGRQLVPLGFHCMQKMNEAGFLTKSIIVKNITGNERGKGVASSLWRYRALANGFYIFKHEYVMVFQKPGHVHEKRARLKTT